MTGPAVLPAPASNAGALLPDAAVTDYIRVESLAALLAEQRALGVLMLSDAPQELVAAHGLSADLFAERGHAEVFAAVLASTDRTGGGPIEMVDLVAQLERDRTMDHVGGMPYLEQLPQIVDSPRSLARDVDTMRSARHRALLEATVRGVVEQAGRGDGIAQAIDGAMAELQALRATLAGAGALFSLVPVADLAGAELPAPSFWWEDYLPARVVTLLGAHGGTGKSTVALMLLACIATGRPFFGVTTRPGVVAYFSAEDPADLIRHRLQRVCKVLGIDPAELDGRLLVLDATGADPVLFSEVAEGGRRYGATTAAYSELRAFVAAHQVDVLVIDNASDVFGANENDRSSVRAFMRALARIAQDGNRAVMLLAHVDKGTSRGDRAGNEGYSGSTAWHNSARSRLYLTREKDGSLRLEHQKANLGPTREPVTLEWLQGSLPQVVQAASPVVQGISDRNHIKALLRLIHEFTDRGEFVTTATAGRVNAVIAMSMEPTFPKLPAAEIFDLLRRAERSKQLRRASHKDAYRKVKEHWEVTPDGCRFADIAANAANAANGVSGSFAAASAEPAANAANAPPGGVGGTARAHLGGEVAR